MSGMWELCNIFVNFLLNLKLVLSSSFKVSIVGSLSQSAGLPDSVTRGQTFSMSLSLLFCNMGVAVEPPA